VYTLIKLKVRDPTLYQRCRMVLQNLGNNSFELGDRAVQTPLDEDVLFIKEAFRKILEPQNTLMKAAIERLLKFNRQEWLSPQRALAPLFLRAASSGVDMCFARTLHLFLIQCAEVFRLLFHLCPRNPKPFSAVPV
jgi:hypothetical protein